MGADSNKKSLTDEQFKWLTSDEFEWIMSNEYQEWIKFKIVPTTEKFKKRLGY